LKLFLPPYPQSNLQETRAYNPRKMYRISVAALTFVLFSLSVTVDANPAVGLDFTSNKRDVGQCLAAANTTCPDTSDGGAICESGICGFLIGTGVICLPSPSEGSCYNTTDCITHNCSFAAGDVSYCEEADGTTLALGTCEKGGMSQFCYTDENCIEGCQCDELSTSNPWGACFCP